MSRRTPLLLAGLLLLAPRSEAAGGARARGIVPVARGPVLRAISRQLGPLLLALPGPAQTPALRGVSEAFRSGLVPTPQLATPENFAARSFLVSALASPKKRLPRLVSALEAAGGKKASRAAFALRELGAAILAAPESERRALTARAAALLARFDGAAAAPGEAVDLTMFPTDSGRPSEKKADRRRQRQIRKIRRRQKAMYAGHEYALLVDITGPDTSGKGGSIEAFSGIYLAWFRAHGFKKPMPKQARRHYLERVSAAAPQEGEHKIVAFDRDHYEDIVKPTMDWRRRERRPELPKPRISRAEIESRYRQNGAFEWEMIARGVAIVKIFLNVSEPVQAERLEERRSNENKQWKVPPDRTAKVLPGASPVVPDFEAHKEFNLEQAVRAETLARGSFWWSPWNVVAADNEPRRNYFVVRLAGRALKWMDPRLPVYPELARARVPRS